MRHLEFLQQIKYWTYRKIQDASYSFTYTVVVSDLLESYCFCVLHGL